MKRDSNAKKKLNYEQVDSIVSGEVVFIGDITSGNSMRFEGNMRGNVNVSGNFIVGRNALITGNIKANNVHVIGTVDGNIDCEQLKILSTGKVTGDATVDSIIIDEGAFLVGKYRTREDKSDNPDIEDILNAID
ncbi:MAG: polymer-forming cytoskeletal protein [Eubacteriaceae bacterium]|nr:polymer-forming cytoskeletal protein [Eubacteriaceae bacterium]MBR5995313.1 polymer-forming cytoskeletal protein [Eubacteriaceae bacterium]